MSDTTPTHSTRRPGGGPPPDDAPREDRLRGPAAEALLVALMLDFLAWIGAGKEVTRERLHHPFRSSHHTLVALGCHLGKHEDADEHVRCPFDRGAELLTVALKAHILKLVPERTERRRGDVERQYGWVIPGAEYGRHRHDPLRLLCALLGHAPTFWRLQDPRVHYAPAERVMHATLALLAESTGGPVLPDVLWERVRDEGVPVWLLPGGIGVLSALGVVEHRELPESSDESSGEGGEGGLPRCGAAFTLTPLGAYAVRRCSPLRAGTGAAPATAAGEA
ncbi:hypothetical protein HNR23_000526 [Nocardiopsis mwathae]|uniref:Uncharacterized protein n=1 Tax=Nocardiopsis mwathae TaxID=1472723 RepID=A0A7X0D478_9ACTN|nr:hypothetical protein [Nocardiopsis mwathae]MBB6170466.1 hypothetical protein [Nocardiopsis mwathae]